MYWHFVFKQQKPIQFKDNLRENLLLTLKDSWGELGVSKQVGFDKGERGFGNSQWLRSGTGENVLLEGQTMCCAL